jgi:hypothetical protein
MVFIIYCSDIMVAGQRAHDTAYQQILQQRHRPNLVDT